MRTLRLPRHRSTTAHLRTLYPWHTDDGLGQQGVMLGRDLSGGGGPWCYDPFQMYASGVITSPNIVVLGQVGSGKSAAVKAMLLRSIGQLRSAQVPHRWCAVLDPKGEYGSLAEALGLEHLRLARGGSTRLNPLDAAADGDVAAATAVIVALAGIALRRTLTPLEEAALGWLVDDIATRPRSSLTDLVKLLAAPTAETLARGEIDAATWSDELLELRHAFGRLLDSQLRGMFDGTTTHSAGVRGVVVDLSAVHHDRDALTAVMVAATGWIQRTLRENVQAPLRMQVFEEVWALLANEHAARYIQACQKLARSYGVANVLVAHRTSDLRAQSDDGTASAKIGTGLVAETQTRVLFRIPTDQVADAMSMFDLSLTEQRIVTMLRRGRAIWHVGDTKAVVQHELTAAERRLTGTDEAMGIR